MDIRSLVRKNILAMKPYSTARDEFMGQASIFLDANENPYPLPYNRYPDPLQGTLKKKVSALKGVAPESIFFGNGSDEAIDLLMRGFCEPGNDAVIITEPTYGMYSVSAAVNNIMVRNVPLTPTFDLDAERILKATNRTTRMVLVASPNNPTGNDLSESAVLRLLSDFPGFVVVDEAYIDFAGRDSYSKMLSRFRNLVVLQTFSKAWGLAGARLGMCFADPEVIAVLNKIKYPYNINSLTIQAAEAALERERDVVAMVSEIIAERKKLMEAVGSFPFVKSVYPSDANFFLIKTDDARRIYNYLLDNGIIVRDRSKAPGCENCLRITVGTPDENQRLLEVLKTL